MKSRLAVATRSSGGLISVLASKRLSKWIRPASSTSRTADPAIHSEGPQGIEAEAGKAAAAEQEERQRKLEEKSCKVKEENPPISLGKLPYVPQPTLECTPVKPPPEPIIQQKRKSHGTSSVDASCVGVDGSPLPSKGVDGDGVDELVDYYYYKDHKPSPLSEVEFVDTRKPITRATDGTAGAAEYGGDDRVIGWREEQLDTTEEALERAIRIWKENAMRGDPDAPHSRALRALLGELN